MKLPKTPFHLLYDGERFHVVLEGGEVPVSLAEAWASGRSWPNAIRILGWYGSRMRPGWYVGMIGALGDGRAYKKVRCMARAKTWIKRRYVAPTEVDLVWGWAKLAAIPRSTLAPQP